MSSALPNPEQCCTTCDDQVTVQVPGPTGDTGAAGSNGTDGVSSFTTVNQGGGFTMPATNATVVVTVVDSSAFTVGQYVYVQNAGYLKVSALPTSTSMTLLNENYPDNAPASSNIANGSKISPAGIKGLDGGVDFSTITTADFDMPKVNTAVATATRERTSNVATIVTGAAHGLATGDYVEIAGVSGTGYNDDIVQVTVTNATTFTYANTGSDEGTTADVGGTVTPNVQIEVSTSLGFVAGQDVFIQNAGYFYLQAVPDATHLIVQNNGSANNETAGTTIASGVRVSVSLNLNSLSPTTSKGQILVDNGANDPASSVVSQAAGTNGQVLVYDSAQTTGLAPTTIVPNTATDNAIARFNGASGTPVPLQTSLMAIADDGAIQSTPTGGNARGSGAIDLQVVRGSGTQVASGTSSVILGGENNTASGILSVVVGGQGGTASGLGSIVIGSASAVASGGISTVIGGGTASANAAIALNGGTASGSGSFAVGSSNIASGLGSSVFGGGASVAAGDYSSAFGLQASAALYGERACASGFFTTAGDAQTREFTSRISTSDATPTELGLTGGSSYLIIPNDTTWTFDILISARRTDADDESAAYRLVGCIDRNGSAATTALVGTVTKTVIAEDTAAWDVAATADTTNGYLAITVTGEASKTIYWVASVKVVQVTG